MCATQITGCGKAEPARIAGTAWSPSGRYVAVAFDTGGGEACSLRLLDTTAWALTPVTFNRHPSGADSHVAWLEGSDHLVRIRRMEPDSGHPLRPLVQAIDIVTPGGKVVARGDLPLEFVTEYIVPIQGRKIVVAGTNDNSHSILYLFGEDLRHMKELDLGVIVDDAKAGLDPNTVAILHPAEKGRKTISEVDLGSGELSHLVDVGKSLDGLWHRPTPNVAYAFAGTSAGMVLTRYDLSKKPPEGRVIPLALRHLRLRQVGWSPTGDHAAVVEDGGVSVIDLVQERKQHLAGSEEDSWPSFSRDGMRLATVRGSRAIVIYDLAGKTPPAVVKLR